MGVIRSSDHTLHINPVPASRPRAVKGRPAYYPKTYANFREAVKPLVLREHKWPTAGPVQLVAFFYVEHPKKTILTHPKPDIDNYLKALMDALNGAAYADDCQVVDITGSKFWAEPGDEGRIWYRITELTDEASLRAPF